MDDQVKCPKCGSTQISADKKGFSGTKAVAGAALTGGIGLLAGTIGSNKVKITCLKCGHVFNPGDKPVPVRTNTKTEKYVVTISLIGIVAVGIFLLYKIISIFS